jgi:hypothetical protein
VIREGRRKGVDAVELVPDDVVVLTAGSAHRREIVCQPICG